MDKIFDVEIDGQVTLPDGRKLGPFEETTINVVQPSSDPVVENAKGTGGGEVIYFDAYSDGEGGVDLANGKTCQDIADAFGDGNPNIYIRLPDEGAIAQVTSKPTNNTITIAMNAGQKIY